MHFAIVCLQAHCRVAIPELNQISIKYNVQLFVHIVEDIDN